MQIGFFLRGRLSKDYPIFFYYSIDIGIYFSVVGKDNISTLISIQRLLGNFNVSVELRNFWLSNIADLKYLCISLIRLKRFVGKKYLST